MHPWHPGELLGDLYSDEYLQVSRFPPSITGSHEHMGYGAYPHTQSSVSGMVPEQCWAWTPKQTNKHKIDARFSESGFSSQLFILVLESHPEVFRTDFVFSAQGSFLAGLQRLSRVSHMQGKSLNPVLSLQLR